jgi:general secretion pathway protein G
MKKIPLDPWGSPYRYEIPAKWNKSEKFDVFSIGPDKQPYTDDDIGNWDFGWPPPDKKPAWK